MKMYKRSKPVKCARFNWNAESRYALSASKLTERGLCAPCFLESLETLGFVTHVNEAAIARDAAIRQWRSGIYHGWTSHRSHENQDGLYV